MSARPSGRRSPCDARTARDRLAKARQFLTVADLAADDASLRSAEASLLVHGGIASADAICCVRSGQRSADGAHAAAVDLLASADRDLAKHLRTLLGIKALAQYDDADPSSRRLVAARRAAGALLAAAEATAGR